MQEPKIDFLEIINQIRLDKNWDVSALGQASGLTEATISRLLQQKSKVTLSSAVSLCYALDLNIEDLVAKMGLADIHPTTPPSQQDNDILSIQDIEAFIRYYQVEYINARSFLRERYHLTLIRNQKERDAELEIAAANQIGFATHSILPESKPLPYPKIPEIFWLQDYFIGGSTLILADAGRFIHLLRKQQGHNLLDLEALTHVGKNALSNLENGVSERLFLADILSIDQALKADGEILSMYWAAAEFQTGILRNRARYLTNKPPLSWNAEEYALADTLVRITRHWDYTFPEDKTWLTDLHYRTSKYYQTSSIQTPPYYLVSAPTNPDVVRALAFATVDTLKPHLSFLFLPEEPRSKMLEHIPDVAQKLWDCLAKYAKKYPGLGEIWADLVYYSNEDDYHAALRVQLRKILWDDEVMGRELQKILLEIHEEQ